MSDPDSESDPLVRLAEEFAGRHRRGERPSPAEYAARYPELASRIHDLFPALVLIEEFGSVGGGATGPHGEPGSAGGEAPRQLGDYRILRELGRGGMGVVYEAVQESLGRHVALKVLPSQVLASPTLLERFRQEARAAARLHHTNIVPVFGVGEQDGVHFYAMQYIRGQGLDLVVDQLRRLREGRPPGEEPPASADRDVTLTRTLTRGLLTGQFDDTGRGPRGRRAGLDDGRGCPGWGGRVARRCGAGRTNRPTRAGPAAPRLRRVRAAMRTCPPPTSEAGYYRGVARVGLQAAEALAYAHSQGILHRDIKPSNLLLDASGTVWVADFGLAKAEGTDALTRSGDIVGTLRYMAPERFEGHSDPRGDVYGLGATLYELLTLRPAFEASNRAKLIERLLHDVPVAPRKLDTHIPRDLETVVLKAMAKEPGRRYATAEALAEDLRRFLEDRPIRARRVSSAERLLRWGRRNKLVAGLLAGLVVTLVAGLVVSTSQWIRAEAKRPRRRSRKEAQRRAAGPTALHLRHDAIQQAWMRPATSAAWASCSVVTSPGPARRTGAASSGTSSGGATRGPGRSGRSR